MDPDPMEIERPFALLITWTCYGTWLPGDRRGYVSNTLVEDGGFVFKENRVGVPPAADDPFTRRRAKQLQRWPKVLFTPLEALDVAQSLSRASHECRWNLLAAAVMSNHVHVLVTGCPDDGAHVRRVLKGRTRAELSRLRGSAKRWWTSGGSDRYLHDEASIAAAIKYVEQQRGILAGVFGGEVRAR
jgi:REP element-mobilizing transposase RayT